MSGNICASFKSLKEAKLRILADDIPERSKLYLDKCFSILEGVQFDPKSEVNVFMNQGAFLGERSLTLTIGIGDFTVALDTGTYNVGRKIANGVPLPDSFEDVLESFESPIPAEAIDLFRQFYEQGLAQQSGRVKVTLVETIVTVLDANGSIACLPEKYVTIAFSLLSDLSKAALEMTYEAGSKERLPYLNRY